MRFLAFGIGMRLGCVGMCGADFFFLSFAFSFVFVRLLCVVRGAFETVSTTGYNLPLLSVIANEVRVSHYHPRPLPPPDPATVFVRLTD